ncbi:MAG: hypothetical protein K2Z81_00090, partial [Cyanobacteria bacterium]|nr:hypothetical protein [Cyanobacteriota bacterium]
SILFILFFELLFLPSTAAEPGVPLRGLQQSPQSAGSTPDTTANVDTVPADDLDAELAKEDKDAPDLETGTQRFEPPDPGVLSEKSRLLKLPLDRIQPDRLTLKSDPPSHLISVGKEKLPPIKLEASYTEWLSLKAALNAVRENNLPIKISQTQVSESKFKYMGTFGNFLPIMSMNYTPQSLSSGNTTIRSDPYFITIIYPYSWAGERYLPTLPSFTS